MASASTNPIGPGTVNRTVNLPRELDERLGKAVYQYGAKSRGEILREALSRYLAEFARDSIRTGNTVLIALGCTCAIWGGVTGQQDQIRRTARPTVRIVKTVRKDVA